MRSVCGLLLLFSVGIQAYVFKAHLPGAWYANNEDQLRLQLNDLDSKAAIKYAAVLDSRGVRVLFVPHAGYAYSGEVAAGVYRLVRDAQIKRVIIVAPSHHVGFAGIMLPSFKAYQTPLGVVPVDSAAVEALHIPQLVRAHPEDVVFHKEHALEIQLPLIQFYLGNVSIVPLLVGDISDEQAVVIAHRIRSLIDGHTIVVISSDFTHYGKAFQFTPFKRQVREQIRNLDAQAVAAIEKKSVQEFSAFLDATQDTICGRNAIKIALHVLGVADEARLIGYATSADADAQITHSVSYVGLAFTREQRKSQLLSQQITQQEKKELVRYARAVIHNAFDAIFSDELIQPMPSPLFQEPRGVFVTLYKNGQLRGCIGRIISSQPLVHAVKDMALAAAFHDSRFLPLKREELADISISISVLTQAHRVPSYHSIELGRHGIIMTQGNNTAVFLPKVAKEMGWNLVTTLQELSKKAGLSANAWQDKNTVFEVFESIDIS